MRQSPFRYVRWALMMAGAASLTPALAFVSPERSSLETSEANPRALKSLTGAFQMPEPGIRTLRHQVDNRIRAFSAMSELEQRADRVQYDAQSGALRLLSGVNLDQVQLSSSAQITRTALEQRARDFALQHAEVLKLDDASLSLEVVEDALLIQQDLQFLKFNVYKDGVWIEDAEVDFRFKRGQLVQVQSLSFGEAQAETLVNMTPDLTWLTEELRATEVKPLASRYRVLEAEGGYVLRPVFVFRVSYEQKADTIVQLDQHRWSVIEDRPTHFYLDGRVEAELFPRYYREELQTYPLGELEVSNGFSKIFTDGEGRWTSDLTGIFRLRGLEGERVTIRARTGGTLLAESVLSEAGNSALIRVEADPESPASNDKRVAQAMVYQRTLDIITYAREFIQTRWFDRALRANVNLSRTCNAHWDGRTINFYSGDDKCANTGLIADVIYHEWGHGLDANTGGIRDGAFSEGIGDISSMLFTRDNILGIGFRLDGTPVRDLGPDKVYPDDQSGSVHAEGLIIGSTFWDLYEALLDRYGDEKVAIDIVANYLFKVVFTASRYTQVYDALLVIDDDDTDLANGSPHYCILNTTFAQHGLAERDEQRCGSI